MTPLKTRILLADDHALLVLQARPPDGSLVLTIADEGRGIAGDGEPGAGMRGMRERATLVGAQLTIGPNPAGRGCVVELALARAEDQWRSR